jgi:replication factor A1
MQRAACEIRCQAPQPVQEGEDAPPEMVVRLLALEEPRTFSRRDGTTGEMVGALIGTDQGTARLVCWYPPLLDGFTAGEVVRLVGATRNRRSERTEYLISETGEITATDQEVIVPLTPLPALVPDGTFSVSGTVRAIQPAREFMTRNGERSWVRNLILGDQETEVPVVLWGEHALQGISVGEDLHLYHMACRTGRSGSLELSAGWGSVVVTPAPPPEEVTLQGTVVVTRAGTFLDTRDGRYLLTDGAPHGRELEVTGVLSGYRLTPVETRLLVPDPAAVKERLQRLIDGEIDPLPERD